MKKFSDYGFSNYKYDFFNKYNLQSDKFSILYESYLYSVFNSNNFYTTFCDFGINMEPFDNYVRIFNRYNNEIDMFHTIIKKEIN